MGLLHIYLLYFYFSTKLIWYLNSRWLNNLFKLGLKRPIEEGDIYETLKSHESKRLADEFTILWENEKLSARPSFLNVLYRIYAKKVLLISLIYTAFDVFVR